MKVRVISVGEYDRHESEVRFIAEIDTIPVSVTITAHALFVIGEALGMSPSEPLVIYSASGRLLELVVAQAAKDIGEIQRTYLITYEDVFRVTGHEHGFPHVPKRWDKLLSR